MDSMGISIKMVDSKEYKIVYRDLNRSLMSLKQQLETTKSITEKYDDLKSKGYEQYRTYCNNKRLDKITNIPLNPVYSYKLDLLIAEINKFFAWEKKFKETGNVFSSRV